MELSVSCTSPLLCLGLSLRGPRPVSWTEVIDDAGQMRQRGHPLAWNQCLHRPGQDSQDVPWGQCRDPKATCGKGERPTFSCHLAHPGSVTGRARSPEHWTRPRQMPALVPRSLSPPPSLCARGGTSSSAPCPHHSRSGNKAAMESGVETRGAPGRPTVTRPSNATPT